MATKKTDTKLIRAGVDDAELVRQYSEVAGCSQRQALSDLINYAVNPEIMGVRRTIARAIIEEMGKDELHRLVAKAA